MIYCVEDDSDIRNMIIYTLNASGYEAEGFPDGVSFWEAMSIKKPLLVLLDIMLPGEDGIEILKKLKSNQSTKDIGVIMTTAKGTEYDKVIGLDSGADDYLAKPFGMMEMIARVKALTRRLGEPATSYTVINGPVQLDIDKHRATVNGKSIVLTLKEYDLLLLLATNPERVFTREQLLEKVWGMDYIGESRTIDVHIGTLRTKLGDYGSSIETIRGVGYRMVKI